MSPADAWPLPAEASAWPPPSHWAPAPPPNPAGEREGFAIASLVLGILPVCGGVLAIVFGILGFRRAGRTGKKGRVMAAWGTSLGFLWLVGFIAAAVLGVLSEPQREPGGGFAERGKIIWSDLRTGDCIERDPGNAVHLVTVTRCGLTHEVEVFDTFTSTSDDIRVSRAQCLDGLNAYLGAPSDAGPHYEVDVLQSEDGAEGGPAVCLLLAPRKASLYRTVRSSWPWQPAAATTRPSPGGAATGAISLDDLRPRDCISRMPKGAGPVTTLPVVPCRARHAGEVYDVHPIGKGGYPGDAQVDRLSIGRCRATLPGFVGSARARSGYSIRYYQPSRESWAVGGTTVICVLVDPDGGLLTGDAKGAGRNRA